MSTLGEFTPTTPLVLVGCGNMGGAMLKGWLARGVAADSVIVIEPKGPAVGAQEAGLASSAVVEHIDDLDPSLSPRAVVFAVKPGVAAEVVPGYRRFSGSRCLFLSIVAGRQVAFYRHHLGAGASIVRAMPNTPASVGRAMSGVYAGAAADERDAGLAAALMAAVGAVTRLDDEAQLDLVTAVSGSGPAYAYYLVECMAEAGCQAGLPAEMSMQLARAAISGAGELLHVRPEPAAELRRQVTSPAGTTEAALKVMMADGGLREIMTRAIAAAARRSRELAG